MKKGFQCGVLVAGLIGLAAGLVFAAEPPVAVPVAEPMHPLPNPLDMVNWKQNSADYYRMLFDPHAVGRNLPAVAVSSNGTAFGINGYLVTNAPEINGEAENNLGALVGAELLGLNMKSLYGFNWDLMGANWFSSSAGMYVLRPSQSAGQLNGGIYGIWPMALGYMYGSLHSADPVIRSQMLSQSAVVLNIAELYGAPNHLNFNPDISYDIGLRQLVPATTEQTAAMGAAANFGWQLLMGYQWTGNTQYLACAQAMLQWQLDHPARYESVVQHGPLAVARLDAQYGYNLDLARMMDSFYGDGNRAPAWSKPWWGLTVNASPGGLDADGLDCDRSADRQAAVGWNAFSMGTFQNAAWLAPVARYDQRFAHSIGRTLLNLANSARFLRGIDLDWYHQDHKDWRDALPNPAWYTNALPYQGAGYLWPSEKLSSTSANADGGGVYYSPYDTGDDYGTFGTGTNYYYQKANPPIHFSADSQNIAPYSGNHVGFLGLVWNSTDVAAIPAWDLLGSDYYHPAAYPSYLVCNPFTTATNVNFNFGSTNFDLYDAVSGVFLMRSVSGTQSITMGPDQAMVLVCAPPGGTVSYSGSQMLVNGVVVDYRSGGPNGFMAEYCSNPNVDNPALTRTDGQVNFNWGPGTPDSSITTNNFSARWTGSIVPQYSQTYTLTVVSSNSVRLWVNGQLAVNNWPAAGGPTNTASLALTANDPAAIRLEMAKTSPQTQAQVALYWSSASQPPQLIPAGSVSPARGYGLQGEYYRDNNFTNLALVRPDAAVNFNWGAGSPDPLMTSNAPWSARWTGWVVPGLSDTYTLTVVSGGGVRLWLDNQLVISNWNAGGPMTNTCTAALWAGQPARVRLECGGSAGNGLAQLSWVCPSQPETEIVPANRWLLNATAPGAPATPSGLSFRVDRTRVLLAWVAVPGATSYGIYRALSAGGATNLIAIVGTTNYVDNTVSEGTSYVYCVVANNAGGQSGASATVTAVPAVSSAPTTLDKLLQGQAVAAYSLKLLTTNYPGYAVQVRRSSDNATLNIGFTAAGLLDTNTLLNFVGAANGYVTVWYDQSGNGINVSQGVATNQPQLVTAGAVNLLNGYPALAFNGSQYLSAGSQSWENNIPYTYSVVCQQPTFSDALHALVSFDTAGWLMFSGGSTTVDLGNWGDDSYYTVPSDQALHVLTALKWPTPGSTLYVDDSLVASNSTPNNLMSSASTLYVGTAAGGAWSYVGNIPEMILFDSNLSGPDLDTLATSQWRDYYWPAVAPLASRTVLTNSTVVLTATAYGPGPLAYQWQFNGTNLAGQTNSTLTLNNVTTNQSGAYAVAVTNAYGGVVSSPAQINVLLGFPPVVSVLPSSAQVLAGYAATFTVVTNGTPPFSYVWFLNGAPVNGQTSQTLTVANCTSNSAGIYTVRVSNNFGMASNNATLTVLPAPLNTLSAAAQAVYSLRLLRTNYTGKVLQVRRSSDNTTTNIGFTAGGYLDTPSLLNFVGAGNGYVTIWYDQSGNGRNVTQGTATNQPLLVSGGSVNTVNGQPALNFNGSQFLSLANQSWEQNTPYTYSILGQVTPFNTGGTYDAMVSFNTAGWLMFNGSSSTLDLGNWGDDSYYTVASDGALHIWTAIKFPSAGSSLYRDGSLVATNSAPANLISGSQTMFVGSAYNGSWSLTGNISELLMFASDLAASDQQWLENNQGTAYAITVNRTVPATNDVATITLWPTAPVRKVGPFINGAAMEDLNHELYGGLYAQMIYGESFEEGPEKSLLPNWQYALGIDPQPVWQGQWWTENNVLSLVGFRAQRIVCTNQVATNGTIDCDLMDLGSGNDGQPGLVFNYDSVAGTCYVLAAGDSQISLWKYAQTSGTQLVGGSATVGADGWQHLRVALTNGTIQVYAGSNNAALVPVINYTDGSPLTGSWVGFDAQGARGSIKNLALTNSLGVGTVLGLIMPRATNYPGPVSQWWSPLFTGTAAGYFLWDTNNPYNTFRSQCLALTNGTGAVGLFNQGLHYFGLNVQAGATYQGRIYLRTTNYAGAVTVALQSSNGAATYASASLTGLGANWAEFPFTLTSSASSTNARFAVWINQPGAVWVDQAVLMPTGTNLFQGLPVRADIANALIKMGVHSLRLGGDMSEIPNYRWKTCIGNPDQRSIYDFPWYAFESKGWSIEEFMQFCSAAGFTAIPTLSPYETPQDIADFVQYCNGATNTTWGWTRATNGHPAPYNLKYIQLGNGKPSDSYCQQAGAAVHAVDPSVTLFTGTVGWALADLAPASSLNASQAALPGYVDSLSVFPYDSSWGDPADFTALITYLRPNISPLGLYVQEINSGRHDFFRALTDSAIMNVAEANSDFVRTVDICSALEADGAVDNGWDQGLIFFNNSSVWLQPPAQAFATRLRYLETNLVYSSIVCSNQINVPASSGANYSANSLSMSATVDDSGSVMALKLVNLDSLPCRTTLNIGGVASVLPMAFATTMTSGALTDVNTAAQPNHVLPVDWVITNASTNFVLTVPAYSFTAVAFQIGTNNQAPSLLNPTNQNWVLNGGTITVNSGITSQPASQTVVAGSPVTFNVATASPVPVTYQWLFNGANLGGATNGSLTLNNVQTGNAGGYSVVISNAYGTVTSATAILTVSVPLASQQLFNVNVDNTGSHPMGGAAVLGSSGDQWATVNNLGTANAVPNSAGSSAAGMTFTVAGTSTFYGDANAGPNPLNLMYDYAYLNGGTITGTYNNLSAFNGDGYTLVVYAAGNNPPQGSVVTVNGQTLTVAGDSRNITTGVGHAYQIFTGTITNGQLLASVAPGTGGFAILDGAQLQIDLPGLAPVLSLQPTTGQLVLQWPLAATGFSLCTTPVLGPGANWTLVTNPVPVVDPNDATKMRWTGSVTGTKAFYRLQQN